MPHPIIKILPLGMPWPTPDPFLFCVHHNDHYPAGNSRMAPDTSLLAGREMGNDFSGRDGWSMYHGREVPGFPQHPHCGFETITIARRGYIDHSDSTGAAARFGQGDVQWMTAGGGVVHSEMFPLVHADRPNHAELFQIWLNLPRADKSVEPYFTMFWADQIPNLQHRDTEGRLTQVSVVAGNYAGQVAPPPPPNSWASKAQADLAIYTLRLEPGARFTLPAAKAGTNRALYFFAGQSVAVAGTAIDRHCALVVDAAQALELVNGSVESELLMLQGRPIGEPVVTYGPFVGNTRVDIEDAFTRYRQTGFGGWPWPVDAPTHAREETRFARHGDGRIERPSK